MFNTVPAKPVNPYWNNCELQPATNEITEIFELRPPTPTDSLKPTSQAIYEYINGENGKRSHITTPMMETVSETSDFVNLLMRLIARENFITFNDFRGILEIVCVTSQSQKLVYLFHDFSQNPYWRSAEN